DLPEWYKFTIVCLNSLLYLLFFFPVIFIPPLFVFYFIILVHFFSIYPRLTAQRRAGLPVRKVRFGSVTHNIQFDVTLFKAHEPLIMRPLSDETHEGE
ncbi:MAG: hypothetical protein SOY57_02630, partial [Ruminococcus bromii]|nr:hypothetical protein [Ruminococcus bromii]